jgi:hypothetical protein
MTVLGVANESKTQTAQSESVTKAELDSFKFFQSGTEIVDDFTPRKKIVTDTFSYPTR